MCVVVVVCRCLWLLFVVVCCCRLLFVVVGVFCGVVLLWFVRVVC